MFRKAVFLLFLVLPLNLNLYAASIQASLLTAIQSFMADPVIFEQFRERVLQSLQKNKSLDLSSLQGLLDYYGIKQQVVSKNEAIELILKAYHAKRELIGCQDSNAHVLVLNKELPATVSYIPKFDFRHMNEAAGLTFLANAPCGVENHAFQYHGDFFSAGLTVGPVSSGPTVLQLMAQDHARRDRLRYVIERNPSVYLEYIRQRAQCIEHIKRMIDVSSNLDALAAQLTVNDLLLWDAYDEGVILVDWVKPGIQNLLFSKGNFIAIDSPERLGKLLAIADKFLKQAMPQKEYIQLLQEYKNRLIPGADILLKRALGTNGYWDAIKTYFSESLSFFPPMIDAEVVQSPMIQNCVKIVELCKNEKFDEARKIIASLQVYHNKDSTYRINEAHYLSLLVENEYSRIFNSYGIRYSDTMDPYYPLAKSMLDACAYAGKSELQKAIQETIHERRMRLDHLLARATSIQKESSLVKAIAYKILDAQNDHEVVDILSGLAKDHSDEQVANAYTVFVSKGFPYCLTPNACAKKVCMPASIETMANQDIRTWYGYCVAFKIETNSQKELIQRSLEHLSLGCKESLYKDDHLYIAQRFYNDAASTQEQKLLLKLHNLALYDAASVNGQLEREVLKKLCQGLAQVSDEKETLKIIETVNRVGEGIQSGQVRTMDDLHHIWNAQDACNALSGTSEIYPEKEHEIMEEEFSPPYGCGTSFFDEFQRAFFDFSREVFEWEEPFAGACFPGGERAKTLFDPESQEIEEEIDVEQIPQCNAGQQTLPSLGECAEEVEGKQEGDISETTPENDQAKEIIENIIRGLLEGKSLTEEQSTNLEKFKEDLKILVSKYGEESVFEAIEVYNLNYFKLLKKETIIALNELANSIQRINKHPQYVPFKYDIASNGKVTTASIQEAIAGIACIQQEILGELIRSKNKEEDFIETSTEKFWDVKTARSFSLEGLQIFKSDRFCDALSKAYESNQNENIIVQITNLSDSDLQKLYDEIVKRFSIEEIKRTIVVDANNAERSKKAGDLLKMWKEKKCQ